MRAVNSMKYWLIGILSFLGVSAAADVTRASLFVDRVVLTSGGELLGRVEDLALDAGSMQVAYVVVSVGSYLIDDNLTAVTPETLTESETGEYLVIAADALVNAPRFDADSWPDEAQIDVPIVRDERLPPASNDPGVAEIIGGDRRMTLDETGQTAMTQFEKPHLVQQLVISRPKHFIRAW
jgi:sporulation protein YlmC with PRC-barrel domain